MQTIGERLEEARKKKGISIREAAEATKIRGDYLQKFESNHFDLGLGEIYNRGFLRTYSNFLKLPADRIISDYEALGQGGVRTRQPSREIYGRMDISVAHADEAATPATEEASSGGATGTRPATARSRVGTSLPSGPDPAVVFRYLKWGGAAVGVIVILLVLRPLFSPAPAPTSQPSTATKAAPAAAKPGPAPATQPVITLVAVDTVFVRVCAKNADDSEGAEVFKGTLSARQTQVVPWNGALYINFAAGENLEFEVDGRRYPTRMRGAGRVKVDAPRG
jgi:transcriptional regulator with XRE-family HTH domain